jgi:hypothetical protein
MWRIYEIRYGCKHNNNRLKNLKKISFSYNNNVYWSYETYNANFDYKDNEQRQMMSFICF